MDFWWRLYLICNLIPQHKRTSFVSTEKMQDQCFRPNCTNFYEDENEGVSLLGENNVVVPASRTYILISTIFYLQFKIASVLLNIMYNDLKKDNRSFSSLGTNQKNTQPLKDDFL